MTREPDDGAGWGYLAALVPFYFVGKDIDPGYEVKWRRPLVMEYADQDQQKLFYEAVAKLPWLASKVRRAVMAELGLSLREQNVKIEKARTVTLQYRIDELKARMRANGERPKGGSHDVAVATVARQQGMTVEALTKRLHRVRRAK